MWRWILLIFSLVAAGMGLLTVVKAPAWLSWKIAILASEFGYWAVPLTCWLALEAWLGRRGNPRLAAVTGIAALLATVLLAKPSVQAWCLGRRLPEQLRAQLGPAAPDRAPFSFLGLLGREPASAPPQTLAYSGDLKLDLYRALGRPRAPGVIVVHGGGWNDGERGQIPQFNRWLARQGYVVADLSYRLAPRWRWPAQREDIVAAAAFLRAHAADFGLDPTRLVLLGRSAGGQLAEATGYAGLIPLRGVVGLYAPADMNFAYAWGREDDAIKSPELLRQLLGGPPAVAQAAFDSASAIQFVRPDTPPTLLIHGELDTLVWHRQSERLDRKLAEAGVRHVFLSLPWATHAVEYNLHGPSGQLSTYALAWFLAAVTK